jgi:hypothetical protein
MPSSRQASPALPGNHAKVSGLPAKVRGASIITRGRMAAHQSDFSEHTGLTIKLVIKMTILGKPGLKGLYTYLSGDNLYEPNAS